ncbi:MAG: M67 family metallopeptidase [Thermomicrobiales bacterium]|nr:M67 family metallopeptidase [Thermomicrobiales bacterium]
MSESAKVVQLPAAMRDEIIAHAREEAPRECCGVIAGRDGEFLELHRMVNLYPGVDFYEPDSNELYLLYRDLDDRGLEFAAIYHSLPVSVAYPSVRDVEHAGWPDSVYLICSLEFPEAPTIRAFRIADETITELTISE